MVKNYYRQLFPSGKIISVPSPLSFKTKPCDFYNDMLILRPRGDEERKLFLFSLGHEYCHPEKYYKSRLLKNRFIVHFIINGSCYYHKQRLERGDAFLLWPNRAHDLICIKDEPMELLWVDLTGTHLEEYLAQIGFSLERPAFKYHFEDELLEIFKTALYGENPKVDVAEFYAGIMRQIMSLCKFELRSDNEISGATRKRQVERLKQLMFEAQYQISTEQLAEKMGYSRKHISKIFTEETGETPTAYKNRKRIELAQSMLQYEQYSVNTVAEQLGYYDVSAFSRAFKHELGYSPRAYRAGAFGSEKKT